MRKATLFARVCSSRLRISGTQSLAPDPSYPYRKCPLPLPHIRHANTVFYVHKKSAPWMPLPRRPPPRRAQFLYYVLKMHAKKKESLLRDSQVHSYQPKIKRGRRPPFFVTCVTILLRFSNATFHFCKNRFWAPMAPAKNPHFIAFFALLPGVRVPLSLRIGLSHLIGATAFLCR